MSSSVLTPPRPAALPQARRVAAATLGWSLLLVVLAAVAAAVLVPRLAGAAPYTVLTGSMAPAISPGDLVVVRPVRVEEIDPGSVITFQPESGVSRTVTHRVVGVASAADGERLLTTRGDANPVADAAPVRAAQVRGEVWYAVPWVGRVSAVFSPEQRAWLTRLLVLGVAAYAVARACSVGRYPRRA